MGANRRMMVNDERMFNEDHIDEIIALRWLQKEWEDKCDDEETYVRWCEVKEIEEEDMGNEEVREAYLEDLKRKRQYEQSEEFDERVKR